MHNNPIRSLSIFYPIKVCSFLSPSRFFPHQFQQAGVAASIVIVAFPNGLILGALKELQTEFHRV